MQVQSIKNKNCYTTFNAKFCIGGDVKSIPQESIFRWTNQLKNKGKEADAVILHIGSKENFTFTNYLFGLIPQKVIEQSRYIFAVANINGKICDKNLSYVCKGKKFNADNYLINSIDNYINELLKK